MTHKSHRGRGARRDLSAYPRIIDPLDRGQFPDAYDAEPGSFVVKAGVEGERLIRLPSKMKPGSKVVIPGSGSLRR